MLREKNNNLKKQDPATTIQTPDLQSMHIKIKKLTIRLWAGIFIFILIMISSIFLLANHYYEQYAQALTGNYGKAAGEKLTANEWNTLANDFVDKSGDTMSGNLTAPDVCSIAGNCLDDFNLWKSPSYSYAWSDPNASNTVNLGVHKFCALSRVTHDGGNGGWCDVYKSGNDWFLDYGKWGNGGITCIVMCF